MLGRFVSTIRKHWILDFSKVRLALRRVLPARSSWMRQRMIEAEPTQMVCLLPFAVSGRMRSDWPELQWRFDPIERDLFIEEFSSV